MRAPWRRSSARPKVRTPADHATLTDHLGELRTRIIRCLLAVALCMVVVMVFYDQVLAFLTDPLQGLCASKGPDFCSSELLALSPVEGFSARLRISMYGGIILALPIILWQIWRFVVPALHPREKRYAVPFIVSTVLLFLLGGWLAYYTLDKALEWLIAYSGQDVQTQYTISKYVSFVMLMILAFGVGFEFPVLIVFLQLVGIVTPRQLLKQWRISIMAIFVIAAVVTPSGDPISMLMLAIPMVILYLLSIVVGWLVVRRRAPVGAATA